MPSNVTFIPNPLLEREWELSPLALGLVGTIGGKVAQEAERLAPKDTGTLAASIHVEVESQDGHPGVVIVADAPYAAFVELGTYDTPAQPFLRPAIEGV